MPHADAPLRRPRYAEVRADYAELASSCGSTMFHDIVDMSTLRLGDYSGGTVLFWQHLRAHVASSRLAEFVHQLVPTQGPFFGIGVLSPNDRGTAEPDTPVASWPHLVDTPGLDASGRKSEQLWHALCGVGDVKVQLAGAAGAPPSKRGASGLVARVCHRFSAGTSLETAIAASMSTDVSWTQSVVIEPVAAGEAAAGRRAAGLTVD